MSENPTPLPVATFPQISAKSLDEFDVGVTLGTGSFGRVRFATHKVSLPFWCPPHAAPMA